MRGKRLRLLGWDDGVAVDQFGHDSTDSLNTLREGRDIQQEQFRSGVSALTGQDASLNGGTVSDGLIGVDSLAWLLSAKVFGDQGLHLGDARGSTHQYNLIDLGFAYIRVVDDLADGSKGLLEQISIQLLETGAGQGLAQIEAISQILDFETGLLLGAQGTLDALDFLTQLLQCALVLGDIDIGLLLHHLDEVLHDTLIEILSSQVGVSVGGQHLEDSVVDSQ
mmetsp:Transcript_28516/g.41958  ORF Transcript_28516/g.41958 Transcript_28516/m.41958 type:complete len:223 (+) Transcript_28516:774-1442(+)